MGSPPTMKGQEPGAAARAPTHLHGLPVELHVVVPPQSALSVRSIPVHHLGGAL
jgi:hypothetical protein